MSHPPNRRRSTPLADDRTTPTGCYILKVYTTKEANLERADRAKIFWSGRSQAVRLPKEYRFEGTEVRIRRRGDAVILEPSPTDWHWLDELISSGLDSDFVEAVEARPDDQDRPGLEKLFD